MVTDPTILLTVDHFLILIKERVLVPVIMVYHTHLYDMADQAVGIISDELRELGFDVGVEERLRAGVHEFINLLLCDDGGLSSLQLGLPNVSGLYDISQIHPI